MLVAEWASQVRSLSAAKELPRPILIDHLPDVLVRIADMIESANLGAQVTLADIPKLHALDRLARGFDLEAVIKEYSLLRHCILTQWERMGDGAIVVSELQRLEAAVDQSITEAAVSFGRARERMLKAVDRISDAALGTTNLDAFLHDILQATLETTEAVDTAALLLREGDVLRLCAAVGIDEEVDCSYTVKLGKGIVGKIAAEARPIELRHAAEDPRVESDVIRQARVRALYGVPLSHAGLVMGVAYIGSCSAFEFSDEDKLLFRTMASRVTSVIVQNQLVMNLQKIIADRDHVVSELAGERARLEQILNQIPAGVIIADAPGGEISFVNERTREILGDHAGPSQPTATRPEWELFHLDGTPYRRDDTPRHRALRGKHVVDEFKVRRPDGRWVMIRATAAPLRDHGGRIQSAIVAFDDVSAQKRYEDSLRFLSDASRRLSESVDYERTLAQIAQVAVPSMADWLSVELLRDGILTSVVAAHSDPVKLELAKELRRRFPPDLTAGHGSASPAGDGGPRLFESIVDAPAHLRIMRELGMVSGMVVPLNIGGRVLGALSFATAEPGRRYGQHDLELGKAFADRAAMAIENARLFREAERAVRLREEVLAAVSHDLRNPLAAMTTGAALLLKKYAADPRTRKQVETIHRAASRMERLIGDLLDMASIQAGRLAIERRSQEIAPIIAEAIEAAEPVAKANGQLLTNQSSVGAARCTVDRDRVLQLFENLLGNAKKFCPAGGSITVRAKVTGSEVECSISDTGPGIPDTELPHIFEPYWSAQRHSKKGLGLGLHISKGIVEAHGGRIWAESDPGVGATFYFTVPLSE